MSAVLFPTGRTGAVNQAYKGGVSASERGEVSARTLEASD